ASDARRIDQPGERRARRPRHLGSDGHAGLQHALGHGGHAVSPASDHVLPDGMPRPVPEADKLDASYWEGTRARELRVQRCHRCREFQWGPEWICHRCLAFDMEWVAVAPRGRIYSWERAWHPVHPALKDHGPYVVVLVELPEAGNVRMLGNLVG